MIKFQQIMSASVTTEGANSCMTEKIEVQGKFENEDEPIKHTISEQHIEIEELILKKPSKNIEKVIQEEKVEKEEEK